MCGKDGYDKLAKIRPVLTAVQQTCVHNYSPHKECSVDEAMIKLKGQSTLKQYMPKQPIKRGIKVWVRAYSHTGYISQFYVYSGKDSDAMLENLGESVVVKLSLLWMEGITISTFTTFLLLLVYWRN